MRVTQTIWTQESLWQNDHSVEIAEASQLVLAFGSRKIVQQPERFNELRSFFPNAQIIMNSTSGEIMGEKVMDDSLVATAIHLEKTKLKIASVQIEDVSNSYEAGKQLTEQLKASDLQTIFVISDGQKVNGSELVKGLNAPLDSAIPITGGLAGDGPDFQKTVVGLDAPPTEGKILAVGFYGTSLIVGHGSKGGWDPFGPERIITKSDGNVLYELNGQSALDLYKKYLGDQAEKLPGAALLFPLSVITETDDHPIVRTILSIDEENKSMTFAGELPLGARARLMKANFDRLIDGAHVAAGNSYESMQSFDADLAILISCVGRKLVLKHRIEEEVEGVVDILGKNAVITGFYSYGEISPFGSGTKCELHNQTMTISSFTEK